MSKEIKRYSIDQCVLYKCRSKRRLEQLLCIEAGGLKEIESIISYHSFNTDKKCTKKGQVAEKRKITAPNAILKQIQARILYLLQKVERPDWLISGEKGKCYIDNGKAHLLGTYVLDSVYTRRRDCDRIAATYKGRGQKDGSILSPT